MEHAINVSDFEIVLGDWRPECCQTGRWASILPLTRACTEAVKRVRL